MVLLYGRTGSLTADNGGFRPGQWGDLDAAAAAGALPWADSDAGRAGVVEWLRARCKPAFLQAHALTGPAALGLANSELARPA
jgi:hypothetical protein